MSNPNLASRFMAIADFADACGESPVWSPAEQKLYWTDINGKRFHSLDWATKKAQTVHQGFEIAGFALNRPAGFVIVNSEGFWLWDAEGQIRPLSQNATVKAKGLNDCTADPGGGVIAGSCFYREDAEFERGALLRLAPSGAVSILDEGFVLANGLGFAPDARTLYFADSGARIIYAYDFKASNAELSNRRIFVQVPSTEGIPDGLTVDAEGYIWSAQWFGSGLVRYDPDGKVERRIPVPAKQTSSVTFAGPDWTDVFVTSAATSDALKLAPSGYTPGSAYLGGKLFHANLGIRGKPEFEANVR